MILTMFAKLAGGLVGEEVDGDEVYAQSPSIGTGCLPPARTAFRDLAVLSSTLKLDRLEADLLFSSKDCPNPILPQVFPNRTCWFHFPCYLVVFPTIVDNRFVNRFLNDSRENETKKFSLGKPVVQRFVNR